MRFVCSKLILISVFIAFAVNIQSYAEVRSVPSKTNPLPTSLIGIWQITEVHIDTGATRTLMYTNNDSRLTGRLFTINHDSLKNNTPEYTRCTNPTIATKILTPVDLIGHSMAGRGMPPEIPTPKDYSLPLEDNTPIEVLSINCKEGLLEGNLGAESGLSGAWMITLSSDKLAVRWYDETILVLRKLPENAKPMASFDCEKASSLVEKTICGSIGLAAFDKSIGQSYSSAVNQYKKQGSVNTINQLRMQQKEWLATRDKCGGDIECLEKTMVDRLETLESAPIDP